MRLSTYTVVLFLLSLPWGWCILRDSLTVVSALTGSPITLTWTNVQPSTWDLTGAILALILAAAVWAYLLARVYPERVLLAVARTEDEPERADPNGSASERVIVG